MIHIVLPDDGQRLLVFYLAMEEYVPRILGQLPGPKGSHEAFFTWQVPPTVIFGRNQVMEAEINLEYCREHKVNLFRRKSGGGCVYADRNNVMLSYVTRDDNVEKTFARYMDLVADALRAILQIDTVKTQNNDLLIGDAKVSGNAIYHIPGKIIAHGTLLYDTVMKNMISAITPSSEKLQKHGVESVRQRITLLKDHTDMPLEEIKSNLRNYVCHSTVTLTEADVEAIKEIEKEYLRPEFIFGK